MIRNIPQTTGSIEGTACLHKSRKPPDEVEFSIAEPDCRADQQEECEGICGIRQPARGETDVNGGNNPNG